MGKVSETMAKWGLGATMAGLATVFAGSAVGCFEGDDKSKEENENKSESKDNKDED